MHSYFDETQPAVRPTHRSHSTGVRCSSASTLTRAALTWFESAIGNGVCVAKATQLAKIMIRINHSNGLQRRPVVYSSSATVTGNHHAQQAHAVSAKSGVTNAQMDNDRA